MTPDTVATISKVLFETGEDGNVRALLHFEHNDFLEKLGFKYLSIPIDESVTEMGALAISRGDKTNLYFAGSNLRAYDIFRPYITKAELKTTTLPKTCNVCGCSLHAVKNLLRKVKRLECRNRVCGAHSRSSVYRLFEMAGIEDQNLATLYMNDHYTGRITHLWDLVLFAQQNEGDPNTTPREQRWNGKTELWQVEKKLHEFLINSHNLSDKDFWYIGFGIELDLPREVVDLTAGYPKIVLNNLNLVKQLENFFKAFNDKRSS